MLTNNLCAIPFIRIIKTTDIKCLYTSITTRIFSLIASNLTLLISQQEKIHQCVLCTNCVLCTIVIKNLRKPLKLAGEVTERKIVIGQIRFDHEMLTALFYCFLYLLI